MGGLVQILIGLLLLTLPQSALTKARGSEGDKAVQTARFVGGLLVALGAGLAMAHFASR
jgi:hypothetical protein